MQLAGITQSKGKKGHVSKPVELGSCRGCDTQRVAAHPALPSSQSVASVVSHTSARFCALLGAPSGCQGLRPMPDKVEAILKAPDVHQLRYLQEVPFLTWPQPLNDLVLVGKVL